MTSTMIKTDPETSKRFHQACRLCLREEFLGDIFIEKDLRQWISDLLSILVSPEDRLSHVICACCRGRLTDFHQFRNRCQEVQIIMKSTMEKVESEISAQKRRFQQISVAGTGPILENRNYSELQDTSPPMVSYLGDLSHDSVQDVEEKNQSNVQLDVDEGERSIDKEDIVDIEQVKIESPRDDGDDTDAEYSDNPSSTLRNDDAHKIGDNWIYSEQTVADNGQLVEMEENISKNQPLQCKICQKVFKTRTVLSQHMYNLHKPKIHVCKLCDIAFPNKARLKNHELSKKHLNKLQGVPKDDEISAGVEKAECEICHKTYRTKLHLKHHVKLAHGDRKHRCNVCNIGYSFLNDLQKHELTVRHMDKLMESPETQRLYAQDIQRIQALIQKANDKAKSDQQWPCDICGKCFSSREKLTKHKRFHGSNNFICPICEKPCRTRLSLKEHIPTHDPTNDGRIAPDAEPSLECAICLKKFWNRTLLTTHVKSHTNEEQKARVSSLKCDKVCKNENDLKVHNEIAHKERIKCSLCHASFVMKQQLERHVLQKHKQEAVSLGS